MSSIATPIRRAFLSVDDGRKRGIIPLARLLSSRETALYATKGTRSALLDAGISVKSFKELTGQEESADGSVKLGDLELQRQIKSGGFDLVVSTAFTFEQMLERTGHLRSAINDFDEGVALLWMSCLKRVEQVTLVTMEGQFEHLIAHLEQAGGVHFSLRKQFAEAASYLLTMRVKEFSDAFRRLSIPEVPSAPHE